MTPRQRHGLTVYCELTQWVSFREGYEAKLLDTDPDTWAEHRLLTALAQRELECCAWEYPRGLVESAYRILAAAWRKPVREVYRTIRRRARAANSGLGKRNRLYDALHWLTEGGDA